MKKLKLTINGKVNTFDLPENGEYKCEVEESYVPKVGDCVKVECDKTVFHRFKIEEIVDEFVYFSLMVRDDLNIVNGGCFIENNSQIYTQISPEELKAKCAEAGYDWDYETDTIKPLKWIPKDGDEVCFMDNLLNPHNYIFRENGYFNKELLEKGLLFPTKEECQKFCNYCLKYFEK